MSDVAGVDPGASVGPLPVWGWALIGGGALGLGVRWWRNRTNPTTAVDPQPAAAWTAGGVVVGGMGGATVGNGAISDEVVDATNLSWRRKAITALMGDYDPTTVDRIIGKYLDGDPLTAAEDAVLNAVFRVVGPPPEYVPTSPTVSPGTPTEPTTQQDPSTVDINFGLGMLLPANRAGVRTWLDDLRAKGATFSNGMSPDEFEREYVVPMAARDLVYAGRMTADQFHQQFPYNAL